MCMILYTKDNVRDDGIGFITGKSVLLSLFFNFFVKLVVLNSAILEFSLITTSVYFLSSSLQH